MIILSKFSARGQGIEETWGMTKTRSNAGQEKNCNQW